MYKRQGYELTALTANGRDILSTKRFVVKDNTEVKATFTQKARTYAVTFSKTGEGYLDATGADDLSAVPVSYTHLDVYKRQWLRQWYMLRARQS